MVSQEETKPIDQSAALNEFKASCNKYYVSCAVSSLGIKQTYERLKSLKADPDKTLHVGDGPPGPGKANAAVNIGEYFAGHETGAFRERMARSFVVTIYTEWEEVWRSKIAEEHGVQSKDVKSDLMGDLRKIRHFIIHNDWKPPLQVLDWTVDPKVFQVNGDLFKRLIAQIDEMRVRLKISH